MKTVHVAVGVIKSRDGKILIAKRPEQSHQGGLWEFPGGKIEENETLFNALARELKEELGLVIRSSSPLIKIAHDYGDKKVLLDVHWVTDFEGETPLLLESVGREGQPIQWVELTDLRNFQFPAANNPIVDALLLPNRYAITGDFNSRSECLEKIEILLRKNIKLIQLRAKHLQFKEYKNLTRDVLDLCNNFDAKVQVNLSVEDFSALDLDDENLGLHLRASELLRTTQRLFKKERWLSASCHTREEIVRANQLGVNFICVSPVQATSSHPNAEIMGWRTFADLTLGATCPVYALGGVSDADLRHAIQAGAQGIAAISAWWET